MFPATPTCQRKTTPGRTSGFLAAIRAADVLAVLLVAGGDRRSLLKAAASLPLI